MATGPVSPADHEPDHEPDHGPGRQPDQPPSATDLARLDHQELAERCARAEAETARLRAELARAVPAEGAAGPEPFAIFDDEPASGTRLVGDGSDPRVLSMILTATAVVTGMVAVLAFFNGNLLTPFGGVIVALTVALAWGASRARVVPVEVSVNRGIVSIDQGSTSHRFDVRRPSAGIEMLGQPGDAGWQVRFRRKGLDPFVVDATMVDPHDFVRQLREWRSDL